MDKISQEDLSIIINARTNVDKAIMETERSITLQKIAKLELENVILKIFHKYKITPGQHTIKEEDGTIILSEEKEEINGQE